MADIIDILALVLRTLRLCVSAVKKEKRVNKPQRRRDAETQRRNDVLRQLVKRGRALQQIEASCRFTSS